MIELTAHEARCLGVLIEKATTTPEQYPLSLNALTAGCNQKNNRDPVLELTDDEVFEAAESLRAKGLVVQVDAAGSRVRKYRHEVGPVMGIHGAPLAVLAELLVRGPQTLGELRGRANRMSPINSLEEARAALDVLTEREEPLAKQIPPAPGSRAERYVQLLSADAHPVSAAGATSAPTPAPSSGTGLADRVARLEQEVATLRAALTSLASALGEKDPFADAAVPTGQPAPAAE